MIREPTEYDVKNLLSSSGIRYEDRGHYYSLRCPFHKNGMEKTPSSALYKNNWNFVCFTCGKSVSFPFLYKELNGSFWNEHASVNLLDKKTYATKHNFTEKERLTYAITDGIVTDVFSNEKALAYCKSRGISSDFMQEFRFQATDLCKFNNGSIWQDRLLIPIDYENKPYSIEGRDYTRRQPHKCLYPKNSMVDVCFNQNNLKKNTPLVVCEGLMDIHEIWTSITKNVTATFGVKLSVKQKEFLKDCKDLILFIDDDEAGRNSINIFEDFMENNFRVAIVKGTDAGGATPSQCYLAIKNSVNYGDFIVENSGLFEEKKLTLLKT
ncbi:MAG: toprim domain-containing protein [Bacteroidales bacterium]